MKRFSDLVLSFLGLVCLSPLLLFVSGLLRVEGGPVFFRQERMGLGGRRFRVFKFRSMAAHANGAGALITAENDPRITPLGKWLRKTKWDELPQLLNVLRGEMSLVGPRPEVPRYVELWPPADRELILSVRPGLTDYAALYFYDEQALLAGAPDPEKAYVDDILPRKLEFYREYVKVQSAGLDIRLILSTLARMVRGQGRSPEGRANLFEAR